MEVIDRAGNKIEVNVHRLVKTCNGDVLSDTEVRHVHTIANGQIERTDLRDGGPGLHPKRMDESYGRFAWIYGSDENKIEL